MLNNEKHEMSELERNLIRALASLFIGILGWGLGAILSGYSTVEVLYKNYVFSGIVSALLFALIPWIPLIRQKIRQKKASEKERSRQTKARFYKDCCAKGCTDMSDPEQLLDAKVIATKIKLEYPKDSKMQEFFNSSKKIAEEIAEEQERKRAEEKRKHAEEQKKRAEEQKKRAVNGTLFATIKTMDSKDKEYRLFRRPDGSLYYEKEIGVKIEGYPQIVVEKHRKVGYTYNPAQTVYTGATVGGVTTGGFHQTKASMSAHYDTTGNGYLTCDGKSIEEVLLADTVVNKFKNANQAERIKFEQLVCNNTIRCRRNHKMSDLDAAVIRSSLSKGNPYTTLTCVSNATADSYLTFGKCKEIADLLIRIVNEDYPESIESIYARAIALSEKDDLYSVEKSIKIFESISPYKDSNKLAEKALKRKIIITEERKKKR